MLWDVLLDELNIRTKPTAFISHIQSVFNSNINPFLLNASTKQTLTLMELNKHFLKQVMLAVHKLFPALSQEQHFKKINITNEDVVEAYKIEDIHTERQTEFEKQLKQKQNELESYMTLTKPQSVSFADTASDNKIIEMDSLVAEKLAQRDSELELLYKNNLKTGDGANNWLTPQETSLKPNNITLNINTNANNSPKKVSWIDDNKNDNNDNNDNNEESSYSIFQKLKKTNTITSTSDNKYAQQQSMTLQDIAVSEAPIVQPPPPLTQPPLIPSTELAKQLNDMNTKLEQLFGIVNKLADTVGIIATTNKRAD
jgi:hypothetical protein